MTHLRTLVPRWSHFAAATILALFVLVLFYPLLFTNRVLASGDILLYFYPYRDYAAAALRAGRIPLWNPYIFLGAPLLANPQAAVLYPLHWPLSWLPVTKQIYWSAAIHTWLFGTGGYFLLRRLGIGWVAGLASGLVLAGSGFFGGLIGHINQMNGAAWLPWGFLILGLRLTVYDSVRSDIGFTSGFWARFATRSALFAVLVALMLLAGHTQTAYINLFALGVWSVWPLWASFKFRTYDLRFALAALNSQLFHGGQRLLVFGFGSALGLLLSAAQLWPTVELSGLGLRRGGLSYAEATSFSLQPLHLLWTLLPSYGLVDLGVVFATPAYSEFIAYVGLFGLVLAMIGAWQGRGEARTLGLLLSGLGLFLALGRWNPLYYLLYVVVPGFDLFRTPARWLILYTLGAAVLAGIGMEWLLKQIAARSIQFAQANRIGFPALSIFATQKTMPALLLALVAVDLLLAARALPRTQTTAPQALTEVRTAPAHLLTDPVRAAVGPGAMGRFLGMSTITFDPGDMADWARIFRTGDPPQLSQQSFEQFIIALKMQELLAPNLSLLWRLPAVDGFDGGVLPLQRYNEFLSLLIPKAELVPDGRLREQLRAVPTTDLLNLLNVQYLITDKVRDRWLDDVYYDRQIGAQLGSGLETVVIEAPNSFPATAIGLIGYVTGAADALQRLAAEKVAVAQLTVQTAEGAVHFTLTAGGAEGAQLADPSLDSPRAQTSGATVADQDVEAGRQEYLARLSLPQPATPTTVTVQRLDTPFDVVIQAVTLIDERSGMFTPLLPSDRGRFRLVHSGDVKIYENLDLLPRAYLVHDVLGVDSPDRALAALRDGRITPGQNAVVEGLAPFRNNRTATDEAQIVAYAPERVEIRTRSQAAALLVLSDTNYPGWVATVDGVAAPIYPTNYLFRGVPLPPGEHTVVFSFQPSSWRRGLWLSGFGIVLCIGLALWGVKREE